MSNENATTSRAAPNFPLTSKWMAISSVLGALFAVGIFELIIRSLWPWTWLLNHPNGYGLEGCMCLMILFGIIGLGVKQWRGTLWVGGCFGILSGLLGILGGPKTPIDTPSLTRAGNTPASLSAPAGVDSGAAEIPSRDTRAVTLSTAAPIPETCYSVTLFVPTRYRDLQVLVDGDPARVIDRQLSQIKLQVPRKSGPTQFKLQSNLLSKPREFSLQIDHDNFEHSPFQ